MNFERVQNLLSTFAEMGSHVCKYTSKKFFDSFDGSARIMQSVKSTIFLMNGTNLSNIQTETSTFF